MIRKDIIKIINEEVSKFDFLGNEDYLKEQEVTDLLMNEEFQKQFICDSLLNKNKVKTTVYDSRLGGNWETDNFEDADKVTLEYLLKIEYKYDQTKEPLSFELNFYGDKVDIGVSGWQDRGRFGGTPDTDIEPSGEAWFDKFDWLDIEVILNTTEGDEVKFTAFEKAPPRIKMLFIREYVQSYVGSYTGMDIRTPEMKDKVQNVPYC